MAPWNDDDLISEYYDDETEMIPTTVSITDDILVIGPDVASWALEEEDDGDTR